MKHTQLSPAPDLSRRAAPGHGLAPVAPGPNPSRSSRRSAPPVRAKLSRLVTTKFVTVTTPDRDPMVQTRDRLLEALLAAEGRPAIHRAVDAFHTAGVPVPTTQEALIQLLEHSDERQVRQALGGLSTLLAHEPPRRRPLLEQRLRRLEETAEDGETREVAATLRRRL